MLHTQHITYIFSDVHSICFCILYKIFSQVHVSQNYFKIITTGIFIWTVTPYSVNFTGLIHNKVYIDRTKMWLHITMCVELCLWFFVNLQYIIYITKCFQVLNRLVTVILLKRIDHGNYVTNYCLFLVPDFFY